ncbi:PAS domain-containing protein [Kushneria phyllosphaerae]|uniref:Blue-light photoreceptor n=1 Tax=Kushneria phyllosphaerae TaxID=2100822 RepID=A0A2R8CNG7_9GAMM|nr:PAS domain-containing protein [Kushneria phyllosphaerae]SPJ34372.1 Blue-light photoreceptor [Kushneria phyllosphaerae]
MQTQRMISPELLERVVNASEDGIVVAEREGNENILIYVNSGFERLTGYSADDILYRDCRFLQNGDNQQPGLDRIRDALREGHPCREIIRNYKKDGALFWNELSITPIHDEEDQLLYFIGVQKDVSSLVEAQQELERLRTRVEETS